MNETAAQAGVVAFLDQASSYPGQPTDVRRIDTHSASVFLAGDRAFKMKRAVRYTFLDFSTLDARRAACEAEYRLNRRAAPDLYLGVEAVTRDAAGGLSIGGHGTPVEWLVVMRRFADEALLDRVAVEGRLTSRLAARLAEVVATFHGRATPAPHEGGAASMREVVDDNTRALEAAADLLPSADVRRLAEACDRVMAAQAARLDARRAGGFVRQCHGDLHLRNIVLLDGEPTLFDAIEFNDTFACIDVWYDVAFLLMDLVARGLPDAASVVFNQYLLRTGDVGGLPLLPLYLATRAAVRAKTSVASVRLEAGEARQAFERRAREYLSLAARLASPATPRLVAVGGRSGSGKSTLAAALAPLVGSAPGAIVLRSDVLRKHLLHRGADERLDQSGYTLGGDGPRLPRPRRAGRGRAGARVARHRRCDLLDARERAAIAAVAGRAGVAFSGLWLEAAPEVMADRLRQRAGDASDATAEVLERQLRLDTGPIDWTRLDASRSLVSSTDAARRLIGA